MYPDKGKWGLTISTCPRSNTPQRCTCFRLCVSMFLCVWVRSCVLIIDHVYEAQLRGRVEVTYNYSGEVALVASSRYTKNSLRLR